MDGAHGEAVGATVIQWVDATRVEVQVVPVRRRVRYRRPRIAVARNVVQRPGRVVAVARPGYSNRLLNAEGYLTRVGL